MVYAILEYTPIKFVISPQFSPKAAPIETRMMFQISVPIVVKIRNRLNFILDIPAGMEIKLRTHGTIRQNRTVHIPYLSNQLSALCISAFDTLKICPQRSTILSNLSTSSKSPIPYKMTAPTTEPAVHAITTPVTVIFV